MPHKKIKIRLFIENTITKDSPIKLGEDHKHYLFNVMRQKSGDEILIFNGTDGLWIAKIICLSKKEAIIHSKQKIEDQHNTPNIWLCFAPVKNTPNNNIIQKSTEIGISKIIPVNTEYTDNKHINLAKLKKIAIEAAEQSERLTVPKISKILNLEELLEQWPEQRTLFFCDESGNGENFFETLSKTPSNSDVAIIIGPEGGFSKKESEILSSKPYVKSVCIGPRILRADTASIVALTCCFSKFGDWNKKPKFKT